MTDLTKKDFLTLCAIIVLSPAIVSLIVLTISSVLIILEGKSAVSAVFFSGFLISYFYAPFLYAGIIFVGIPTYILLEKLKARNTLTLALSGLPAGLVVWAIYYFTIGHTEPVQIYIHCAISGLAVSTVAALLLRLFTRNKTEE